MQAKQNNDIFHYLSKVTIILPIVIVILAILIKFTPEKKVNIEAQSIKKITPEITPKTDIKASLNNLSIKESTPAAALDLKGPWVCNYDSKEATLSAYIKDKKIYAKYQNGVEQNILIVNGDCAYHWVKGKSGGEKYCNIGQYLGIIETLQSLNIFDMSQIASYLPQLNSDKNVKDIAKNLTNVCKKDQVNESWFVLPKSISFKESEISLGN